MSLALPEFAVREIIERALDIVFDDPLLLDDMLGELAEEERDSFRTALEVREGKVRLGWAQSPPEDWLVTVVLANTQPVGTLGGWASEITEEPRAEALLAAACTKDAEVALVLDGGIPDDIAPRGLVRIGNEVATYHLNGAGDVCTLKARGVRLTTAAAHGIGADVTFFDLSQRIGYPQWTFLRVDVLGSNPPFLMALASIIQAFLMHARELFDERGYSIETITVGDLAPRAEAVAHLFARTLTLKVLTAVSLPERIPALTQRVFTPTIESPLDGKVPGHATL